ncbi:hypothetical protein [Anaeromyxobacter paludicola]|uniref:Glycosyltransferase RgtA/B/C/D-like domain-containing protein n=1 Tax=Anaeromyxobacter paludicola TaxID=2918171 RepID=A0ABN6N3S4_9BACT|nr:hypothetical protein [Anaeromyxobacter paludicola]BDG07842.1 hypothetical protein AMPC_09550 [Anaeromyxobacter paludicola]
MTSRLERAAAALLLCAVAAPFFAGRFLPLLDLPQHLAIARVVAHPGDPLFARYYAVELRVTPYWGYYAAMAALQRLLPVELANRLLLAACAVAVPLALAGLLQAVGRDPRWAVLGVPLAFHTNLFFGFTTFALSVPAFLWALGAAVRLLRDARPGRGAGAAAGAASAVVFLCHAQTYLLLGLCVLALFAVHGRGLGWSARRALAFLPSLALFAVWAFDAFLRPHGAGVAGHTPEWRNYGGAGGLGAVWEPPLELLRRAPERLLGAFDDGSDLALGGALLGVYLLALLLGLSLPAVASRAGEGRAGEARPNGFRAFLRAHPGELLCLLCLAAALGTPFQIAGQWYLAPRYLVFAALLAPAFLRAPRGRLARLPLALAAVVGLAACVNTALHVRAFQREVGPLAEVLEAAPPGGRLLYLPFDTGAGGGFRLWPFLHAGCYYQVLRGGDVGFSFAGLPSLPVVYRPGMQAPHPYEWRPGDFDWARMGPSYDLFLARGALQGGARALPAHAEVLAAAGPWTLWRRRSLAP